MKLYVYLRGEPGDAGQADIERFAGERYKAPLGVINDRPDAYSGYRRLQNLIKLGECDTVLLRSLDDLGEDKYIALENKLFLERNGARIICVNKPEKYPGLTDRRRSIVLSAARCFSFITEWDTAYGNIMPAKNSMPEFKRKPPFGYVVKDGEAVTEERAAEAVGCIFRDYIEGYSIAEICADANSLYPERDKPFQNMTVKTVLKNERYLGKPSKKGYHLPSLITYDTWLKAKERLAAEYSEEVSREPYFADIVHADRRTVWYRCGATAAKQNGPYHALSPAAEKGIERLVASYASQENADKLFSEYVLAERSEAENALDGAEIELKETVSEFNKCLAKLVAGDRSLELQARLDELKDRKTFLAMRVRRIGSEAELFSLDKGKVDEFFSRCRSVKSLSIEEKRFAAGAFIERVRIKDGKAYAIVNSPLTGRAIRHELKNVLIKEE